MELKGFKSFANKTKIEFDSQITAVVGPNGSGKSNISDAVRWVLGEQSIKSLRGSNMKDVIFQGAKNAMNIAEVCLNFSNEDKRLDLAYDKVSITRRIYRSGENEYKINGKRCRLKDIRELFFDTGVGKEGYSIIGQGRIDEIIMSTPADRRVIFEEAAGISKHKYRREEADKKLKAVSEDLEIIEKELEYKKKDYDLLKAYKDNYLAHKELSEDINKKAYFYLKNKSYDLIKKRDEINLKLKESEKKLASLESSHSEILEKLGPFKKKYETLREDLDRSKAEAETYEKNIERSKANLDLNIQKKDYDLRDKARIEEDLENLKDSLISENKSFDLKNKELGEIAEKISSLENDLGKAKDLKISLEKEISELNTILDSQRSSAEEIKEQILDYEVFEKSRAIIDQKRQKDLAEKKQRLEALDKEILDLSQKLDSSKENQEILFKEKNDQEMAITNLADDIKNADEKYRETLNELNNLKLEIKSLMADMKIEKDSLDKNQGYFYQIQDFLKKTKESAMAGFYVDTLANLISVKIGYEEIIDNLMGAGLQNIVTRSKEDTRELINFINREKLGRITFLPIDSINSYRKERPNFPEVIDMAYELVAYDEKLSGVINHFLGSTVVVKDIDAAINLSRNIKGYRIISLNLDIINNWGSMVAGSDKNKRSNVNLLNRKKKLKDLSLNLQKSDERRQELEEALSKLDSEINEKRESLLREKTAYDLREEKIKEISDEISRISLRIESLINHKESLNDSDLDYEETINNINIDSLRNDFDRLSQGISENESRLEAKNKEFDRVRDEISALTNKLEISKRDKVLADNARANIEEKLADIKENIKIQEKLAKNLNKDLEESLLKNDKLIASIDLYVKEFDNLKEKIKVLGQDIEACESENSKLIDQNTKIEEDLNKENLEKVKLSYKLENLNKSYSQLEDEISPFISISIKDLWEKYKDCQKLEVKKNDLIDLQKRINEIGYFTPTALEDFDNVAKELDFVEVQIKDLKNAKEDIEKMILALEKEMKEEFSKNFAIINENFTKIFKILFMGGDARLILDSEDFLTAGVEIEAKPPSKSLKSISLLSGGEKALTAVALLFAIFEQNPAPFSILDEIDAALDESNIKRYIEYLKSLSDKTQFIMITHRQTTMQLAEKIHGVTIDDQGISRLYSIAFKDN
ncbi:chromosome segregation protein SMC [uncultured Anaerococcus sp.]|uniref:chromosome segregation protein SMC n=1 Tax=uncultured Anaerococcus sp. TaxID=293428 RepID=UPI00288B03AC|nr:chromosome segregation protein SMC [uncultured Anaerococcus sp.]